MGNVALMRNGLRESARDLQKVREQLLELKKMVPLPPQEPCAEERDEERDPLSEMKAIVECGLHDCLEPLIQDLLAAAEYQMKSPRRGQPLGGIDLDKDDETTRQELYELVRKDNFLPGDGDAWVPPYTAEEAQLQVFRLHARWFATWLKLEEPGEVPEARRRELLLLEASEERPGVLVYREV
jgi:hypothetical protein